MRKQLTGTLESWGSFTPGGEMYDYSKQDPDRLRTRGSFLGYKATGLRSSPFISVVEIVNVWIWRPLPYISIWPYAEFSTGIN